VYYLLFNAGARKLQPYAAIKDGKVISKYMESLTCSESEQAVAAMKKQWKSRIKKHAEAKKAGGNNYRFSQEEGDGI